MECAAARTHGLAGLLRRGHVRDPAWSGVLWPTLASRPISTVLPEYVDYYWAINPWVENGAAARVGQILLDWS